MRARVAASISLAAAAALAVGCNWILGVDEPSAYEPSAVDHPNPYPSANDGSAADAAAAGCSADLLTDTNNCGRCGRACGAGLSCTAGSCDAVTLASDLTNAPLRLVAAGTQVFYSVAGQYTSRPGGYCYQSDVFALPVVPSGDAPPTLIGAPCSPSSATNEWGSDGTHVFGWQQFQGGGAANTLLQFGPQAIPQGAESSAGTPLLLTDASAPLNAPVIVPDPAEQGAVLIGMTSNLTQQQELYSLLADGGLQSELAILPTPGGPTYAQEQLQAFAPSVDGFAIYSKNNATSEQRIWTGPRGCDASTCDTSLSNTYPSVCGVKRFGNAVRWCAVQSNAINYLLLLLEVDLSQGLVHVLNTAPVIPVASNGLPVLPLLELNDLGIYYSRGLAIDLLPLTGSTQPIATTTTKPTAITSDSTYVYWSELDAIYRVVR